MLCLLILSAVHPLPHLKIIPRSASSKPTRNFPAIVDHVFRVLSEPQPLQQYLNDINTLTHALPDSYSPTLSLVSLSSFTFNSRSFVIFATYVSLTFYLHCCKRCFKTHCDDILSCSLHFFPSLHSLAFLAVCFFPV